MNKKTKNIISYILIGTLFIIIGFSINSLSTGYKIIAGTSSTILGFSKDTIVINKCADDIFVPTRTENELLSFLNNAPSCATGVSCQTKTATTTGSLCCDPGFSLLKVSNPSLHTLVIRCCDLTPNCHWKGGVNLGHSGSTCCPAGQFIGMSNVVGSVVNIACCSY